MTARWITRVRRTGVALWVAAAVSCLWGPGATAQEALPEPAAVWNFDEGEGSTAHDGSGNANHGAVHGATWTADGKIGGALHFDGNDDCVAVPDSDSLDIEGEITLSAWVRPERIGGGPYYLTKEGCWGMWLSKSQLFYGMGNPSIWKGVSSEVVPEVNTWCHVTAVWDKDGVSRIYLDGIEEGRRDIGTLPRKRTGVTIGTGYGLPFQGTIDEVSVYDRALSPDQVRLLSGYRPAAVSLVTDRTYYDVQERATFRADVHLRQEAGAVKAIELAIEDEQGRALALNNIAPDEQPARTSLNISALPEGDYVAAATVTSDGADAPFRVQRLIHKIPPARTPEKQMRVENGVVSIDGQPTIPAVLWLGPRWENYALMGPENVREVAEHGFDGVYAMWGNCKDLLEDMPAWEANDRSARGRVEFLRRSKMNMTELLDAADENGLFAIFYIPFYLRMKHLDDSQVAAAGRLVLTYRDHPAIVAWMPNDETNNHYDTNATAHQVLREIDPHRPVYLNLSVPASVPLNLSGGEIISLDEYPFRTGAPADVRALAKSADMLVEALSAHPEKSPWFIVQMFASDGEGFVCPTPVQERCMTFLVLNHGIKGLGYFTYDVPENREGRQTFPSRLSPELWASMKELNRQRREMAEVYLAGADVKGVEAKSDALDVAAKELDGTVYVIAANTSAAEVACRIEGLEGKADKAEVRYESRGVSVRDGAIEDTYAPYAVHIYAVRRDKKGAAEAE